MQGGAAGADGQEAALSTRGSAVLAGGSPALQGSRKVCSSCLAKYPPIACCRPCHNAGHLYQTARRQKQQRLLTRPSVVLDSNAYDRLDRVSYRATGFPTPQSPCQNSMQPHKYSLWLLKPLNRPALQVNHSPVPSSSIGGRRQATAWSLREATEKLPTSSARAAGRPSSPGGQHAMH